LDEKNLIFEGFKRIPVHPGEKEVPERLQPIAMDQ
jgi:hypothetical protein